VLQTIAKRLFYTLPVLVVSHRTICQTGVFAYLIKFYIFCGINCRVFAFKILILSFYLILGRSKVVPLHAMKAFWVRGCVAPTLS
jgi:hypothetical protein